MIINSMFKICKKITDCININSEIDEYKIRVRKFLELEISLGELANSTNCYAYCKENTVGTNRDLIVEKYIICMFNLIKLGIDHSYDDIDEITVTNTDSCLSNQFLTLYIDVSDLLVSPCRDHYITLFEDLILVGKLLNLSEDFIIEKFNQKYSQI